MTSISVILCGVLASCKHIQLAIILQFGSASLRNRFSVLMDSDACNFACCKWSKQSDSSFLSISVHCMIYSMNTVTTAYNLQFQLCKSVAVFRSCNTGLMIASIVICLGCTSNISHIWISVSFNQSWSSLNCWRGRLLKAYRQARLHIYFTWRTCIPAFLGHVVSPHALIQYIQTNIPCLLGSYLFPPHTCFLLVTGFVMVHVYENQPVYKLPVPALLIVTLNECNWHEVNDFLFFAGFVNCLCRWEWISSEFSMLSTTCPI